MIWSVWEPNADYEMILTWFTYQNFLLQISISKAASQIPKGNVTRDQTAVM